MGCESYVLLGIALVFSLLEQTAVGEHGEREVGGSYARPKSPYRRTTKNSPLPLEERTYLGGSDSPTDLDF